MNTGVAFCWGNNQSGQLGNNAACPGLCATGIAQGVRNLVDVIDIAAGDEHTCAVNQGGTVYCWGSNSDGQLGLGAPGGGPYLIPNRLPAFTPASRVVAGRRHTCILARDETVWCWGAGGDGQTAAAGAPLVVPTPTRVEGLSNVVALAAGADHTCAVIRGGQVRCWGDDRAGQLGVGQPAPSDSCKTLGGAACAHAPVPMIGVADASAVSAGIDVTCLLRQGAAFCAGDGADGKLGAPGVTSSRVVVAVEKPAGMGTLSEIRVGGGHACVLMPSNRTLWCWGRNLRGQLFAEPASAAFHPQPVIVGAVADVTRFVTGRDHTCVLRAGEVVSCVGDNQFGQVGAGATDTLPHSVPRTVSGLP
jgi:alpha-tubulin suppressor-like RCC1 family protein